MQKSWRTSNTVIILHTTFSWNTDRSRKGGCFMHNRITTWEKNEEVLQEHCPLLCFFC